MDQPTTQINFPPSPHSPDHDILITVSTKLDRVISDVKDLNDNFAQRVSSLENEKISRSDFESYKAEQAKATDDYKAEQDKTNEQTSSDLKFLNRYVWMALGAIALFNLYLLYKQAAP